MTNICKMLEGEIEKNVIPKNYLPFFFFKVFG